MFLAAIVARMAGVYQAPMKNTGLALFAIVAFALPFVAALVLSNHRALGSVRKTALNPMLLVAIFVFVAGADFASMAGNGYGRLGGHVVPAIGMGWLITKYVLMLLAFLSGIALALNRAAGLPVTYPEKPVDMRGVLLIGHLAMLALWFASILPYSPDYFSLEGSVATHGQVDDPLVYATSILLLPTLCYALPRQSLKVALPLVAITVFIVFFSGARARVLYALVPFIFYLVVVRGVRAPRRYVLGIFAIGALAVAAGNVRVELSRGESLSLARVLDFSQTLNSNDVALAEIHAALERMEDSSVNEYLGENLVSFATAPLPRSILPIKPVSGSVQFTTAYDPSRWRAWGSALTVGAINEIEHDYPFPLAILIVALFGAGWGTAMAKAIRSRSIHGFAWRVALTIFIFNFFRNDLFIAGGALWVFAIYGIPVEIYRRVKLGGARVSARVGGDRAPAKAHPAS